MCNKQNGNTLIDTEDRPTSVRGEGVWGLSDKGDWIKQTKTNKQTNKTKPMDTDDSMVITGGKGGIWGGRRD